MKLTREQSVALLNKIDRYIERKENNIFDAFYMADLHIFTKLIIEATMTPEEEARIKANPDLDADDDAQMHLDDFILNSLGSDNNSDAVSPIPVITLAAESHEDEIQQTCPPCGM